ncbi:hypothetical protein AB0J72_14515 [Dactylosporangium sp. NPDC049742]|uniref:Imm32 family immunity protein n=1 Tax=Dactylosporangium sp. NPDC049742 TaxID=3154737 RepID=UPI00341D2E2A
MRVRYSHRTDELDLSGTPAELHHLATLIRAGSGTCPLDTTTDPSPYDASLSSITITHTTTGKASITVSQDSTTLQIHGALPALDILASNVEAPAEPGPLPYHVHIEPLPGDHFLSEDSQPLVVSTP